MHRSFTCFQCHFGWRVSFTCRNRSLNLILLNEYIFPHLPWFWSINWPFMRTFLPSCLYVGWYPTLPAFLPLLTAPSSHLLHYSLHHFFFLNIFITLSLPPHSCSLYSYPPKLQGVLQFTIHILSLLIISFHFSLFLLRTYLKPSSPI